MYINIIRRIIGLAFIAIGFWFLNDLLTLHNNLIIIVLQGWASYIFFYFGVNLMFSELIKVNKTVEFIFSEVMIFPITCFKYFQYVVAPILTVIIFLGIYLFPSTVYLRLRDQIPISEDYSQGVVYILSLLSVLFFAYKGNKIMLIVMKLFQTKILKQQLNKYTKTFLTRLYTYFIMIIIYVLYNFLTFSDIHITFLPPENLNGIKEVLVTFVAIDSMIQIIIKRQQYFQTKVN